MEADPDYIKRLDALPEKERKALKDGNWDIFDGQYFTEFDRKIHVIEPFEIPDNWDRYRTIDYGLDMLCCLWVAIDPKGNEYVYKELYEPNLIVSKAAARILEVNGDDKIKFTYAPPDLWNRRNDTGKSACDIFRENGVILRRSANNRVQGWYAVAEHIKQYEATDEQTGEKYTTSKLKFFNTCINIIRTLPIIQHDEKNANDVAKEPHEFTHAPDALRGFCIERTRATRIMTDDERMFLESQQQRRHRSGCSRNATQLFPKNSRLCGHPPTHIGSQTHSRHSSSPLGRAVFRYIVSLSGSDAVFSGSFGSQSCAFP